MKLSANKDKKLRKKLSQLELEERQYRYLRVNVLNLPYYKQIVMYINITLTLD